MTWGEKDEIEPPKPIRVYFENGILVKVYAPMWAEDSTATQYVRSRRGGKAE